MVELEIVSTFSFQDARWLGDVAPRLLSSETVTRLKEAKRRAAKREQIESRLPKHLLSTKGWPTVMPTKPEAVLLSGIRRSVADIMHLTIQYIDPEAILGRYAELMALNARRGKVIQPIEITPIQQRLWNVEDAS